MIVIKRRYDGDETEPVLAYDGDSEELWGYEQLWGANLDLVGHDEETFAAFFDGPNLFAVESDVDPFEDTPNAEELLMNYPPGSRDLPDVDLRDPPEGYEVGEGEETEAAEKMADAAAGTLAEEGDEGNGHRAAERLAAAAHDVVTDDTGSGQDGALAADWAAPATSKTLTKAEYERCDDFMREMHKRLVEFDGDLDKAPPAWPSDDEVPEFVQRVIEEVINQGGVVWDKFEGYSRQAARAVRNSLEENLTQPQGWSIRSLMDDLQEMYSGMSDEQAANIARTETSAILNTAREEAYEQQEGADDFVYYWQGPADHRRTEVCREIAEEVEARGGNVPLDELQDILREKAEKYEGTAEGGTPERVDEWTPHYQCRHTFVRDVKADL